jgi:hypothetical protein
MATQANTGNIKKYFVISSGCTGKWSFHHRNLAIIGTTDGLPPTRIQDTKRQVIESQWERLCSGTTDRNEYARTFKQATAKVDQLNAEIS